MSETKEKKKHNPPGVANFPSVYFKNFRAILLTDILFAVPIIISAGILALFYFTIGLNVPLIVLPVLICYPFYSGVTAVTRDLSLGREVNVVNTFFKAVKGNIKPFIIEAVVLYLAAVISYFSITLYYKTAVAVSGYLYFVFGISVILALFFVLASFYLPVITVTLDIKYRYFFKNSALMALGELPMNLLTLLCVGLFGLIIFSVSFLMPNYVVGLIVIAVLAVLLAPAGISLIINLNIFPKINEMLITDKSDEKPHAEDKVKTVKVDENIPQDVIERAQNSRDEYIFYNGRMIKRSQIKDEYEDV